MVVVKLFNAGDQVPVTPFVEVFGKAAKLAPEQIGKMSEKVGIVFEFINKVSVVGKAHCPTFGVNV